MEEHIILDEQEHADYAISGRTVTKLGNLATAFLITSILNLVTTVVVFLIEFANSIYSNIITHIITIILAVSLLYAGISLKRYTREKDTYDFDMFAKHINNYWITIWIVLVLLFILMGILILWSVIK